MTAITTKIITNQAEMQLHIDKVYDLLVVAYQNVQGGLHYESKEDVLKNTVRWKIALLDNQIIAVTLFKAKKGLKLVAMATDRAYKQESKAALKMLITSDLQHCWMELSEGAENFVLKYCDGHHYLFHARHASQLLGKNIEIDEMDGFHYKRNILGFMKSKVIVGTPSIQLN